MFFFVSPRLVEKLTPCAGSIAKTAGRLMIVVPGLAAELSLTRQSREVGASSLRHTLWTRVHHVLEQQHPVRPDQGEGGSPRCFCNRSSELEVVTLVPTYIHNLQQPQGEQLHVLCTTTRAACDFPKALLDVEHAVLLIAVRIRDVPEWFEAPKAKAGAGGAMMERWEGRPTKNAGLRPPGGGRLTRGAYSNRYRNYRRYEDRDMRGLYKNIGGASERGAHFVKAKSGVTMQEKDGILQRRARFSGPFISLSPPCSTQPSPRR